MIDLETELRDALAARAEQVPVRRDITSVLRAGLSAGTLGGSAEEVSRATAVRPRRAASDAGDVDVVLGAPLMRGRVTRRARRSIGASGRRHRPGVVIGSAAALAMLVAGLLLVTQRDTRPGADDAAAQPSAAPTGAPTPAATPQAATEIVLEHSLAELGWPPHLLIDDGWELVTAEQRSLNSGSSAFERDGHVVYLAWIRADHDVPDKGLEGATELGEAVLLGRPVTMFQPVGGYAAGDIRDLVVSGSLPADGVLADFAADMTEEPDTIVGGPLLDEALADAVAAGQIEPVPTQGPTATLVWDGSAITVSMLPADRGTDFYDAEEFASLLAAVGHTDARTWLGVLPERVVTADTRGQVVDALLAGVPLPEGFDPGVLVADRVAEDRVNVAAEVQQLVACAWLNRYFQPEDPAARSAAADALATMPDWPATDALEQVEDDLPPGVIFSGRGMAPLTVDDDDTIVYEPTGEELDGYFAAQLCNADSVG